jgi:LmbE family N-acetylglucosaminyl deacetylase
MYSLLSFSLPCVLAGALAPFAPNVSLSQAAAPRKIVAVLAHADDEGPVAPILARYAREGVQIHLLIATDGGQGTRFAAARGDTVPREQELVRLRREEASCAAQALGVEAPILLSFPDGKLGDYAGDRALVYRLTQRIAEELQRLQPDVIVTWGPEGGMGHPDHRMVSTIVTQLQRAGAPGVPDRVFHMYLPAEAIRAMVPQRGEPPLLVPDARYATARVSFSPDDLQAATLSMACHKSQFTPEVVQRVHAAAARVWNGVIPLIPAFATGPLTDVLQPASRTP